MVRLSLFSTPLLLDVHFPDSLRRTDPQFAVRRHPPGERPPVLRQACRVTVPRGYISDHLSEEGGGVGMERAWKGVEGRRRVWKRSERVGRG